MKLFPHAHATHPQWVMAAGLVVAQLRAQMTLPDYAANPTLALLYIELAHHAGLRARSLSGSSWTCRYSAASFDQLAL